MIERMSMHAIWGTLSGIFTAILIVLFALIVAWAWSSARRNAFEAAARLPLEEDDATGSQGRREQQP